MNPSNNSDEEDQADYDDKEDDDISDEEPVNPADEEDLKIMSPVVIIHVILVKNIKWEIHTSQETWLGSFFYRVASS